MPKGTTKRRPETRARMLAAALEVFAEVGFSGATIGVICERAGYTTGAFYSNFASRDELFLALFDRNAAHLQQQFRDAVSAIPAQEKSLESVVKSLVTVPPSDERWFLISAEFLLYAIRNPDVAHLLAAHQAALRADLCALFADVLTNLDLDVTVDLEQLVRALVALRDGALAQSLIAPDVLPVGSLEEAFVPVLLGAVTSPKTA